MRQSKYLYEKNLTTRIKSESKLFWSHVRSKTIAKSSIGKLLKQCAGRGAGRGECETDQETADVLNNVFEKEGDK